MAGQLRHRCEAADRDHHGPDHDGEIVASWWLDGVIPVRWSGPSLNLDSPKVATETLELAHHGFLPAKVRRMTGPWR